MIRAQSAPVGILYTGGTFGMVASDQGYVPSTDLPQRAQAAFADTDLPELVWLDAATGPPVNSSDIGPRFWFTLAQTIREHRDQCVGFVVIHGTDTLAYTSSALAFLLADLDCPVVVTGARAPLGERDSDALDNLHDAIHAVAHGLSPEVTVAFAGRLLRGTRASKRHGSRAHVFATPDDDTLAHPVRSCAEPCHNALAPAKLPAPSVHDREVTLLPIYPGIPGDLVRAAVDRGIAALLLEAYPAGVGPGNDADFVAAVRDASERGVIVAAIPQSRLGSIRLGRYASSTPLANAGLLGGGDMTREAALGKLHWLLGTALSTADIRERFVHDQRGELTANA